MMGAASSAHRSYGKRFGPQTASTASAIVAHRTRENSACSPSSPLRLTNPDGSSVVARWNSVNSSL